MRNFRNEGRTVTISFQRDQTRFQPKDLLLRVNRIVYSCVIVMRFLLTGNSLFLASAGSAIFVGSVLLIGHV